MSLMSFEHVRRTIGFQLTLVYSIIFILSSLVLFALTYYFLSFSVQQKDREAVLLEFIECASQYQKGGLEALQNEVALKKLTRGDNPFLVRLAGPGKNTLFFNPPGGFSLIELRQLERDTFRGGELWSYLPAQDNKDILEVLSKRLPDGSLLQVGKSIESRKEVLEQFRVIFAVIMVPVIIIGFVLGTLLATHVFRPVRQLTETIRSIIIDTSRVDARVPAGQRQNELTDLSALFNSMLERIESLIAALRQSMDNVAHDLRTPMTRLRGIAEIALQSDHNVGLLQEALSDCVEESERMLTMLDTLMDISEAETGTMRLNLEKMDIGDVLREAVDLYSYVAEEKKITINVDIPEGLHLSGDRTRLRQVLSNLLDNALKYTPERGKIDLRAFRESEQIVATVRDSGTGILPEDIPRVWDRLYRGDKSRSQRGLGLGLSMVKAIVQAHKGSVEVSSKPGEGSLFTIRLRAEL